MTDRGLSVAAACGPTRTRHSLSVKEPVSSLPQIYGDASEKLSHMVSNLKTEGEVTERQRKKG